MARKAMLFALNSLPAVAGYRFWSCCGCLTPNMIQLCGAELAGGCHYHTTSSQQSQTNHMLANDERRLGGAAALGCCSERWMSPCTVFCLCGLVSSKDCAGRECGERVGSEGGDDEGAQGPRGAGAGWSSLHRARESKAGEGEARV